MSTQSRAVGALLGVGGGVVGLMAMQAIKGATQRALSTDAGAGRPEPPSFVRPRHRRGEDATEALGRLLFTRAAGREPGGREKELIGSAVHWGYGLAMAAGYGMLRGPRRRPMADLLGGALFGAGLWGLSDELAVPLLGLGDRPGAVPARTHAQALVGHLGYGVATAATIQGLCRVADGLNARRNHVSLRERLGARS